MSEDACTVILASAGTGKTWQLTTRALQLLARGVPPERILASTFTRKAASEILDRILERLAAAAATSENAAKLAGELACPELTRERALELLARLAREVQRFQVSTLDAFFVRVAQALALELGLAPDWTILDEEEEERLRHAAIAAVVARADRPEWTALLRQLRRDASSRPVHQALLRAVRGAYECYADSDEAAWSAIHPPDPLASEALAEAIAALEGAVLPRKKKGEVDGRWAKALEQSLRAALEGDWPRFLANGLPAKILSCEGAYFGVEIEEPLQALFEPLMRHASAELGRALLEQSRATWRVCAEFHREYEALCRARRGLRFEHLPPLLAPMFDGGAREELLRELEARLGIRLDHLLLDEFQDTSPAQWKVLKPLALELCAREGGRTSFFCVGDPKQSIYAWRQAEPRLLLDLAARFGHEPLEKNRRSSPVILATVEAVFGSLAVHPLFASEVRAAEREVAREFASRWSAPLAHEPSLAGSAVLRTSAAPEEGSSGPKPTLALAAARAAELHRDAPESQIAILVRRKEPIPSLLHELMRLGVRASGEGGNPLTDSTAVNVGLSALQLADHPGDAAARFHVATSPLAPALGLAPGAGDAEVARWARTLRRELCERGYARFLRRIEPAVAERYGAWDRGRFEQLVELAIGCESSLGLRPSAFVSRVERQRVEDPSSSRVRVMTIHAAKGLEFDAVLLPELDQPLGGPLPPAVIGSRTRGEPLERYERVSRYPDQTLQALFPELREMRAESHRRKVMEELCVLYVALTRAVHHLELIVAPRTGDKLPLSFEGLLRGALPLESEAPETVLWRHPASDEGWRGTRRGAPAREPAVARSAAPIRLAAPERARELARVSPSALARSQRVRLEQLFAADSAALGRGSRMHAWLERIEWSEDPLPSDAELLAVARSRGLAGADFEGELARLRELLRRPSLAALLSRAECARRLRARESDLCVWRERRFSLLEGEGESRRLLHGAFDRAVLVREGERFVRAELCDFKSDDLGGDERRALERAAQYRPQLEAYRGALSRIAGVARGEIACRIAFLEEERVLDV